MISRRTESKYRKHFTFTAWSFEHALDPKEFYPASSITEATKRLEHLLGPRAIGLVTGEANFGKTTVCRKLSAALHPSPYRVFHAPPLPTDNVMELYKSIGWESGLSAPSAIGH
uniref:AAA domain-containing protein n=1 Tax=Candidatus Kentrum sp. SD TaxID=2126332 RepID=A0A450YAI4_9GAMM|nr:MAG: hypothetical protein BECKSD772F_GA0070984_100124 [Candidatus Kentron sp. SD]VFK38552.1 MAG: hypothetical protein BECKSD772E_GA0070983_100123 [Candidatus Kentron sp. SD]